MKATACQIQQMAAPAWFYATHIGQSLCAAARRPPLILKINRRGKAAPSVPISRHSRTYSGEKPKLA